MIYWKLILIKIYYDSIGIIKRLRFHKLIRIDMISNEKKKIVEVLDEVFV